MFMVYGDQFMPFLMSAILVLCFLYRFLVIIFLPINKLTDEFFLLHYFSDNIMVNVSVK